MDQSMFLKNGLLDGQLTSHEQNATLQDRFPEFWKEFLIVSIEPTKAATDALRYLAENAEHHQILQTHQNELARVERVFIEPVLKHPRGDLPQLLPLVKSEFIGLITNFYLLNRVFSIQSNDDPESKKFPIEFSKSREFFERITCIIDVCFSESMEDGFLAKIDQSLKEFFKMLQSHLSHNPQCFVNPVQLRWFLMLLGLPLFDTFAMSMGDTVSDLYRLYSLLSPENIMTLRNWYFVAPVSALKQYVAIAQQKIVLSVMSSCDEGIQVLRDTESSKLKHAFLIIKTIFEANTKRQIQLSTSLREDVLRFCQDPTDQNELIAPMAVSDFYNDAINFADSLIRYDFTQSRQGDTTEFDLLGNSFVLDAATKAWYLFHQSLVNQEMSGRESLFHFLGWSVFQPYLLLKVRRSDIVHDALRKLTSRVAEGGLKRQLRVIFDEEDAVDEGGVTKEFFQLLVEQLFNPDYGMFTYNETTRVFWFSPYTFEQNLQFELIGVVLGLAIYNGVILDVHFPLAVYKKLLNIPVGLKDLEEIDPEIENSLRQLLLLPEAEVIQSELTFSIDVIQYGESKTIQLSSEYPTDQPVTMENRTDFVNAYVDWILNRSIQSHFDAFHRGFMKCCGDEIQKLGFQPEELLLVICGSTEFEFESLEQVTKYRDGYTVDDETVRHFWEIAHSLSDEEKKRLLFFATGSDRIPVKGLSSLQFYIGRAGADTEKIPTAHTCFNYLLLPDYKDKEKLRKFLKIALENHKGFGLR